ncbi:unnamed protein product, partial [Linum tenue]
PSARFLPCASRKRRISSEGNPHLTSKLGDNVLINILIRLPDPRSACRCKIVCKRWSSLIFSVSFNRLFVSHNQSKSAPPLLVPSYGSSPSIFLTFLPMDRQVRYRLKVFDSFKDLILCGFADTYTRNSLWGRSFLVCNPFTK